MKKSIISKALLLSCGLLAFSTPTLFAETNNNSANASFKNMESAVVESFSVPIISVRTIGPRSVENDQPATFKIKVRNISSKKDTPVKVVVNFPKAAGYVDANPVPTKINLGQLEYDLDKIERLTEKELTVTLMPPKNGQIPFAVNTVMNVDNKVETAVRRPSLRFDVDGPSNATVNESTPFSIVLENLGSGKVRDCYVNANLPQGVVLDADSVANLGQAFEIEGEKQKKLEFKVIALEPGSYNLKFNLQMANMPAQQIQSSLYVAKTTTDIHLVGPAVHPVGQELDYSLIVENNNPKAMTESEIVLEVPRAIQVSKISQRADFQLSEQNRMQLVWPITSLESGKRMLIRFKAKGLTAKEAQASIVIRRGIDIVKKSEYSIEVVNKKQQEETQFQGVQPSVQPQNNNDFAPSTDTAAAKTDLTTK